jgi:peptidoglycan/xylan/chitin deacetylase (PgdA/CDA1 family)
MVVGIGYGSGRPHRAASEPATSVAAETAVAPATQTAAAADSADLERAREYRRAQSKIHFTAFNGGSNRERLVALTFDDGPDPVVTPKILDVLHREHAPATFFVIGKKVEEYPEIVRRAAAEGHDFGNHTYHHLELTEMNEAGVKFEIERTNQALEKVVGGATRWFRAPGCHYTSDALAAIQAEHMVRVDTTDNAGDWSHPKPEKIERVVLHDLSPGDVILCHDRIEETAKALPKIIEGIRARGFRIVSLAELAERAQATRGFRPIEWPRNEGVQAPARVAVRTASRLKTKVTL